MLLMPLHAVVHPLQVIAGATAIPRTSGSRGKYTASAPGIAGAPDPARHFPYLRHGIVRHPAAPGTPAIVAEYFHFQGESFRTAGLGSTISSASDSGRSDVPAGSHLHMATVVVLHQPPA